MTAAPDPPRLPVLIIQMHYTGPAAERAAHALQLIAASVAMLEGTALLVETREREPETS